MSGATTQKEFIAETELVELGLFTRSYWAQRRSRAGKRNIRASDLGPPYHKLGRAIFYRRSEVEEWLARHRVDPVDPVAIESSGKAAACASSKGRRR